MPHVIVRDSAVGQDSDPVRTALFSNAACGGPTARLESLEAGLLLHSGNSWGASRSVDRAPTIMGAAACYSPVSQPRHCCIEPPDHQPVAVPVPILASP